MAGGGLCESYPGTRAGGAPKTSLDNGGCMHSRVITIHTVILLGDPGPCLDFSWHGENPSPAFNEDFCMIFVLKDVITFDGNYIGGPPILCDIYIYIYSICIYIHIM